MKTPIGAFLELEGLARAGSIVQARRLGYSTRAIVMASSGSCYLEFADPLERA